MAKKKTAAKKVGSKKAAAAATKPIKASALNTEQALAELEVLSKELDFGDAKFSEMTLPELRKAVAEGRKALAGGTVGAEAAAAPAAEAAEQADVKGDSVDIVKGSQPNLKYIRTFSKAVHGAEFQELAKAFVGKHGGSIVASSTVKAVRVRWEETDKDGGKTIEKAEVFPVSSQEAKEDALAMAALKGGQVFVHEGKVK